MPPSAIALREDLFEPLTTLDAWPLVLVSAPGGYGKTTLLHAWRDRLRAEGRAVAELALAGLHEDAGLLVEDLVDAIREALAEDDDVAGMATETTPEAFGEELLRRLAPLTTRAEADSGEAVGERLARLLLRSLRDLGEPIAILLDDYQRLAEGSAAEALVEALLRRPSENVTLVVATRGRVPRTGARLSAEGRVLELGTEALRLRDEEVRRALGAASSGRDGADVVPLVLEQTDGWPTGVLLAARALARAGDADPREVLAGLGSGEARFAELAAELLEQESAETVALLETASLLGPVPPASLLEAAGGDPETTRAAMQRALANGLLVEDEGRVGVARLWRDLHFARLRERAGDDDALAERIGTCAAVLEAAGQPRRAADLCDRFGRLARLGEILERHGFEWVERGQLASVERWLARARDVVDAESPEILLIGGLLEARRDFESAMASLDRAALLFHQAGNVERELATLHNVVVLAANEGQGARVQGGIKRLLGLRRLVTSREARGLAILFGSMAAYIGGRYRIARRLGERASRYDYGPREQGAISIGGCQLAYLSGRWSEGTARAEDALADPEQRRYGPAYFTLRALRAFGRGVLGRDPERAIERLQEARQALAEWRLRITEAECALFAGRLLLIVERPTEAIAELEHGVRTYREVRDDDGQTTGHALLARCHLEAGDPKAAGREAETALEAYGGSDGSGLLKRRPWNAAGAAWVLAEVGDVAAADAFARRAGRDLETPELDLCQHATQVFLARIAALAGDGDRAAAHLARAREAATILERPSPDLPPSLLAWAEGIDEPAVAPSVERAGASGVDPLRIETLGGLRVWLEGDAVASARWRGTTSKRLLLRLLCAEGRSLDRERLATDLWPDVEPARGRGNLRVALTRLRRVLSPEREAGEPETWLEVDPAGVALPERALEQWDVRRWRAAAAAAREVLRGGDPARAAELTVALVDDYAGPFAPELLDDWVLALRSRLEDELLDLAREAAERLLEAHPEASCRIAGRLVEHVPGDEGAWVLLVRGHLARGDRSGAARVGARAEEALRRELESEPGVELRALVEQARTSG